MKLRALFLALLLFPLNVFAASTTCNELTYKGVAGLDSLSAGSIASGDYVPVCDATNGKVKKVDATTLPLGGAFNGTVGATTPSTGVFTSETITQNINTSNIAFSTSLFGNPLMAVTGISVPVASINQGYTFLVSQSGKSIIPNGGFTLMASGTATTATAVGIYCSSGNTIATFPIAMLTTGRIVNPFMSVGSGSIPTLASSLTRGCAAGDSIYVSNTGSALGGTTHLMINFPFTVQSNPIQ